MKKLLIILTIFLISGKCYANDSCIVYKKTWSNYLDSTIKYCQLSIKEGDRKEVNVTKFIAYTKKVHRFFYKAHEAELKYYQCKN